MKIAISSTGPGPDDQIDLRFGRCRYFVLVDSETDIFEFLDNEAAALRGGAGLQAAQMLAEAGVKAVISGNIGPNAISVLEVAGIKSYHCGPATVRKALQRYKDGDLNETSGYKVGANSEGNGFSRGGGMGMGRGLGGGRSRGGGYLVNIKPRITHLFSCQHHLIRAIFIVFCSRRLDLPSYWVF
jgi:predicted Fe-Mo cluster-binding NifX family protein